MGYSVYAVGKSGFAKGDGKYVVVYLPYLELL